MADPTVMGYLRLYQILLEKSKANLARALRLFTGAVVAALPGPSAAFLYRSEACGNRRVLSMLCGRRCSVGARGRPQSSLSLLPSPADTRHLPALLP